MNRHNHILRSLAAMAVSAVLLCSCGNRAKSPDTSFSEYIEAYSGGIVSGDESIVIELAAPATGIQGTETEISKAASELFKFSPRLDGTARWTSPQRVEFTPADGALEAGRTYICTFRLGKATETDKAHKEFTFSFMAARKEARLITDGILITGQDRVNATVTGRLALSENIGIGDPKSLIGLSLDGADCEVQTTGGKTLTWTVTGLKRASADKDLEISFKPGKTGFEKCGSIHVTIPAAGKFAVMDARMPESADKYLDIDFSEPLDSRQNLNGLVNLSGARIISTSSSDNRIRVYYEPDGEQTLALEIDGGVKDMDGDRLGESWSKSFRAGKPRPEVSFPSDGSILPDTENLTVPFTAVNLNAVDISIIKIYPSNILMFFQDNDLNGDSGLRRAGRMIYKTTMRLDNDPSLDLTKPNTFTVGLDGLFRKEPGAIYRMRLTFRKEYYIYYKNAGSGAGHGLVSTDAGTLTGEESEQWDEPNPYWYESRDWSEYRWNDRDDPTTPSYYLDYGYPARNLMTSDLGVTVKYGDDGRLWAGVSDILSAKPVSGAELKVYNYQLQLIGKGRSSADGMTEISLDGKPFILTAGKGESTTYLKIMDGLEKSLSRFDTGGEVLQKGLKGFIYGERGVWRPGDTLHLTMILGGTEKVPDTHPVSLDIYTPQGQFFARKICSKAMNGFYTFEVPTSEDSPTGLWNAYFKVGGATFHKGLRIEAIKPNRLKVNVDLGQKTLRSGAPATIRVSSNWLTGPAAAGLQSEVSMTLKPGKTSFSGYDGFTFADPASSFDGFTTGLLDKRLDKNGTASAAVTLPKTENAPGMLYANILGTVKEDGGDESYTALTLPFSPFSAYVGVKLPSGENYLETGKRHDIPVAVVDADGKPVKGHHLEWRIFKLKWSWWWESRQEPLDSYISASAASAKSSGTIISGTSQAMSVPFEADDNDWGRYLIYIKDLDSGHASGGIVYADWAAYRGRSDRSDPDAPAMLSFSTDKKKYKAGETATVYIPAAENGRALVSLEKGGKVLGSEWVRTSGTEDTPYKIKIGADMAPDFYVHITLVQPYRNTANDLPIRMYGVQPVMVENPASHLEPVISMPDKLHPEEPFTIKVSERSGRPMTYTLALVDEGLLDLTAFRTPDPWNFMYRREALGVRTWDMYDDIFCAAGGVMSSMFSIGGDEGLLKGARKENRFNPVVEVLGPFTLKSGSQTHRIKLPMYVGSVRTMVVAGYGGAYGNAEKTSAVTAPVMILPTLPRIAGCGEKITLPVNVFVMEDGIGKVNVSVRTEGPLSIDGASTGTVTFDGKGDKMIRFSLKAASGSGTAKVTVSAEGQGHKMTETVSLEVRNPSPLTTSVSSAMLGKGESHEFSYPSFESGNGKAAYLEACGYPSIGWNSLFSYMENYPHSCTEQLSAKGLSLLYAMPMLSGENAAKAKKMIPSIISSLYARQLPDGGFTYWPGESHGDEWITSMAGEFLTAAKAEGYDVSREVTASWLRFQKRRVQNYRTAKVSGLGDLVQAYRLYTMATSGNADEAAMNRMKESGNLSWQASMMLASAYSVCGKKATGKDILASLAEAPDTWTDDMSTYGTQLRDKAIALEAMIRSGNVQGAVTYAGGLNGNDGSTLQPWSMSTQESAFTARAMRLLADAATASAVSAELAEGNTKRTMAGSSAVRETLDSRTGKVSVRNTSDGAMYVRLITVSQSAPDAAVAAASSGLALTVRYIGPDGSDISPASIRQGTEFTAVMHVANKSTSDDLKNVALTEIIPSGWETVNGRMTGQDLPSDGKYDYLDIRDDRNVFYFSIPRGTYKEFRVRLRAAYEGDFILPSVTCEAMYAPAVHARTASGKASVTR